MPLVSYTSSSEDETRLPKRPTKTQSKNDNPTPSNLPPLPSTLQNLYTTSVRPTTKDNPALHSGRTRQTPHVEGDWPSHIYIEWHPQPSTSQALEALIAKTRETHSGVIESHLKNSLDVSLSLHISLSRPIAFSTDVKDEFLPSLREAISNSDLRPWKLQFSTLKWVSNYTHTRFFLVLGVKRPVNELNKLLMTCNDVVEEYGQPPLYKEVSGGMKRKRRGDEEDYGDAFHVSIAWSLTQPEDMEVESGGLGEVKNVEIEVEEVKVKIGNVITTLELGKGEVRRGGIYG